MTTESRPRLSDSRSRGEGNSPGPLDHHHEECEPCDPGDREDPGDQGDPGDPGDQGNPGDPRPPPQNGLKSGFVEIPIDDNGDSDGESGR